MNMFGSLILVVSALALVGQSMAAPVPEDESLIQHPAPTEQLDKGQLIAKLSVENLSEVHKGEVAEYVAEQLYAAKDKATTEVFEELTVQSLIDLNRAALTGCSIEILSKRHERFNEIYQLDHKERSFDLLFGIVVYTITADLKTFEYCAKNSDQIVAQGIATKAELKKLYEKLHLTINQGDEDDDEIGELPDLTPELIEKSGLVHAKDLQAPYSGALINHPQKNSKLDKDQLIEKLSLPDLHVQYKGRVAEYVAEQLYSAKDKATTEVLEGVTVSSLIGMNTVSLASCSVQSMDMMNEKLEKLSKIDPEGKPFELVFGIFVYASQAEVMVNEYCMAHRVEVMLKGHANYKQMATFVKRLKDDTEEEEDISGDDASDDNSDSDEDDYKLYDNFRENYEMGSLVSTTTQQVEEDVAAVVNKVFD